MEPQYVRLSKKELRRFLEIANGDRSAKNTEAEDTLIRKGLVKESMMIYSDLGGNTTSVDIRAVALSKDGEYFFSWYMNERDRRRKDTLRFWITFVVAVVGALATVISIIR